MSPSTRNNPALSSKITQMRLTIAPIVHVSTGVPPPQFPSTMLELFLLTEDQLDAMARYYAQTTPNDHTHAYPQTMDWNRQILAKPAPGEPADCQISDLERLKIKMRMFARFIGMRNAETPVWEYERQIEVMMRRIERSVREEDERDQCRKWYRGPPTLR